MTILTKFFNKVKARIICLFKGHDWNNGRPYKREHITDKLRTTRIYTCKRCHTQKKKSSTDYEYKRGTNGCYNYYYKK